MESKNILYTTGCPKCKVLKQRLDDAGIEYEICEDVQEMIDLGYNEAPLFKPEGGSILTFGEAIKWLKK